MLRFFKGLLGKKVKEPTAEAPYKVETPVVETAVAKEDPAPVAKPKRPRLLLNQKQKRSQQKRKLPSLVLKKPNKKAPRGFYILQIE